MSAIPRAHPLRGPLPSALRRPTRAPRSKDEAKARCWIPAFAGMTEGLASAARRPLLRTGGPLLRSTGVPLGRGEGAEEKARRGAGTMPARSLPAQGCAVSEPRSVLTLVAGHDARRPRPRGCPFSWLLLFGQAKRSNPSARKADGKTHGCVLGENRTDQSKATANGSRLPPG